MIRKKTLTLKSYSVYQLHVPVPYLAGATSVLHKKKLACRAVKRGRR